MRAALYGRVSTEEQAQEGFSIAAQKEKLSAYAHSQDWQIADYYFDEGVSGKHTDRPELGRMLRDVQSGSLDVVLVYRLDRLTRSVLDLYQLLQEFERYRVSFCSATEAYDTTTAIGRLFITLVAALAQWERENLAERVKLGMEQMALEQKRPGGPPPYGFAADAEGLRVIPEEAEVVKDIFQWQVDGLGAAAIAKRLNQRRVPPKHGSRWAESTLHRMLRNHVYYGALRWNYAEKGTGANPPEKWVLLEDVYEPIITKETFLAAQSMLSVRTERHPRQLASDYLFSGLLHCARCGRPMFGKTGHVNKNGRSYSYRFYHCTGKRMRECDAPLIREDRLAEKFATDVLAHIEPDERAALRALDPYKHPRQQKTASLQRELSKLQARKHRWHLAYLDQVITHEELAFGLQTEREQEERLRAQLAEHADCPIREADSPILLIQNLPLAWASAKPLEKKQLLSLLLERLDADCGKRQVRIANTVYR
ncbi:recombinase family protein [Brevibacillus fluminis]|uniref:Recombinase family protein n=1 Tax=Brevibacillus fluminis TaxID=511487 RepID=A0A3M8DJ81_9BACL|nr:recombinase family protein [Brevibacillus fluminis]RNB87435.1 recombinase family protein [Brevibacillus fluminis]